MSSQYIYTMQRLSKEYPPDKQVLKDVSLQFLPGAKIGVLGYNGAGKSTVLKIMAGIETEYRGDAMLAPQATVGLLEQEPHLDEAKDVKGNVEEAVTETKALLERFNELAANYSEETADEFARLQEQIDAADAWNLDTTIEYAMDALRLPPADADVTRLSGGERRRVALCRLLVRQRTIEQELAWVRENPKGRRKKAKARLNNYEALLAEERNVKLDQVQIHIPPGPRLGDVVVESEGLRKGFGDRLLIEDLSFKLPRGGIVGVIGPNGAGKTTLFRMITGHEQPDAGVLRVGDTVELAYVDQSRDALDDDKSVWEEISGGMDQINVGDRTMNSRAYCSSWNFKGSDQQKKVGKLSGGERNRLHLAKLLRAGGNVLLLDEPTNELDVDTLRALEEALLAFPGCAVVISHDRWFLDRICTHMLAFEGESQVRWFEGNFEAYEERRREELGPDADRPHRITYKKLTRA